MGVLTERLINDLKEIADDAAVEVLTFDYIKRNATTQESARIARSAKQHLQDFVDRLEINIMELEDILETKAREKAEYEAALAKQFGHEDSTWGPNDPESYDEIRGE